MLSQYHAVLIPDGIPGGSFNALLLVQYSVSESAMSTQGGRVMWYNLTQQNKQKQSLQFPCNRNAFITPDSILECPLVQHRFNSDMVISAQSTGQHGYDATSDCCKCCTQSRSAHQLDGFGIDRSHVVNHTASGDVRLLCH